MTRDVTQAMIIKSATVLCAICKMEGHWTRYIPTKMFKKDTENVLVNQHNQIIHYKDTWDKDSNPNHYIT